MSINVNINEKDGIYICQSTSSSNIWFPIHYISEYYKDLKLKRQYSTNSKWSRIFYDGENIIKIGQPDANEKRHFNAHLKEIRLFLEIDKKPEIEEFDGYVVYDNGLRSKIFKAKIRIISDKRFEFQEEGFSFWQTANMANYSYKKVNPEIDKLYDEYQMTKKKYNEIEQKLKDKIYRKEN